MIGDRLDTDILAAKRAGIGALFVSTGVNTLQEAQRARGDLKPDVLLDDLPELCTLLGLDGSVAASTQVASRAVESSTAEAAPPQTSSVQTEPLQTATSDATTSQNDTQPSPGDDSTVESAPDSSNMDRWWESLDGMFSGNGRAKPPDNDSSSE
jgi:hypothetical protein